MFAKLFPGGDSAGSQNAGGSGSKRQAQNVADVKLKRKKQKTTASKPITLQAVSASHSASSSVSSDTSNVNAKSKKEDVSSKKDKEKESKKFAMLTPEHILKNSAPFEAEDIDDGEELEEAPDSATVARHAFEWLIAPMDPKVFAQRHLEKKPLFIRRKHQPNYYEGLFSSEDMYNVIGKNVVNYSVAIDITLYQDGERHTLNPFGRAFPATVRKFIQDGCSARMLHPQVFHEPIWRLCSVLQDYFQSCVGSNSYLTPAGSQGFAPHYDDVDVFILQLEGSKRWRLYDAPSPNDVLPRFSSRNFEQKEIGAAYFDQCLMPGDLLYLPRGTVHQAVSDSQHDSLHLTISSNQKNTWGDFLLKVIPRALEIAMSEDVRFREGLPNDFLDYMGATKDDANSDFSDKRSKFGEKCAALVKTLMEEHVPLDAGADQFGCALLHDSLPPVLTAWERRHSIVGAEEVAAKAAKSALAVVKNKPPVSAPPKKKAAAAGVAAAAADSAPIYKLGLESEVRLLRRLVARLMIEGNDEGEKCLLYHNLENSRLHHGTEPQFFEFPIEQADALGMLLETYPEWCKVDEFPMEDDEEKLELATALYEKALLLVR